MLEYDKDFDHINVMVYREHGINDSDELRHVCTVCRRLTCIDDSYSKRGHKLICSSCANKYLGDYKKMDAWLFGED